MSKFENWLKENGYGSLKDNHDNSCDNGFIMGTEAGWRAALEEVLRIMREQKPEDVQEIIEKELES